MTVGVVVNPVAGAGRMGREWPAARAALARHLGELLVEETDGPGETCGLARKLVMKGADLVIAAGGDGTVSDVAAGLLQVRAEGGPAAHLGILPCSIGSDLARGLGIAGDAEAIAARIAGSKGRRIDAGCVNFVDEHGALSSRHFVNVASVGLSGPTDRAVNAAKTGGGFSGRTIFFWHTVRELLRYKFQGVQVTVDDAAPIEERIAVLAVANGAFFGGGMMIAPDARLDDGLLEVVVVRGTSKLSLLADLRLAYAGAHRGRLSCIFLRGRKIAVEPLGDPLATGALLDIDGETPGRIPATFEVLPGAITVRY